METFTTLCNSIDEETREIEIVNKAANTLHVRRAYVVMGAGVFLFAFLFLGFGASFFSHLIGFLYPAYASFKAIESHGTQDDTQWLTYWVVFACFAMLESFSDT